MGLYRHSSIRQEVSEGQYPAFNKRRRNRIVMEQEKYRASETSSTSRRAERAEKGKYVIIHC